MAKNEWPANLPTGELVSLLDTVDRACRAASLLRGTRTHQELVAASAVLRVLLHQRTAEQHVNDARRALLASGWPAGDSR